MSPISEKSSRPAYDPRRIRRIFDRRAATFPQAAFLPREVARRMCERLDYIKLDPAKILDAGCGLGDDLRVLRARFPNIPVFGADLSGAMLARAATGLGWRRFLPGRGPRVAQADFGALPFASGAFDFLWSNMALHWHARPDLVFPEWRRVLKTGGLLMFSALGPDTLRELRDAYAQAEATCGMAARAHVIDFVDMHDLGDMLVENGFETPVMDQETITVTYASPASLLTDVRRWGAYPFARDNSSGNDMNMPPLSMSGRRLRDALCAALEARRRVDGMIALTFEVVYGHAWKAALSMTAEGHHIVRLEDITRPKYK